MLEYTFHSSSALNEKCLYVLTLVLITLLYFNLPTAVASLGSFPKISNSKVVILNFDDNRKTQFTEAKPILDKYGFKATFYVVCKYLDNKKGYMNWTELETLYKEGHDIGSHTMNHANLSDSSIKSLEY